ncbi:hypothetical protein J6590_064436 [Homalodisca vitripennis]|nr:hypothetical protein J6590_064436 [Homalodisca vitripennis]
MEVIRIDKTDLKYLCRAQNITSHHGTSPGRVITQLSALRGAILPYARKSATRPRDVQSLRRDAAIDPPRSCEKWPRNRGPSRLNRSNRIPRGLSVSGEQSARRWQGAIHVTDGWLQCLSVYLCLTSNMLVEVPTSSSISVSPHSAQCTAQSMHATALYLEMLNGFMIIWKGSSTEKVFAGLQRYQSLCERCVSPSDHQWSGKPLNNLFKEYPFPFEALFCPSSWAIDLCEDLIEQRKGESRYSTRSMVLILTATVIDKI